jgi:hypothetical protein
VNGLLLKLLEDKTGRPRIWFWKLFAPIRQDLDRYFWCFANQPWMCAPDEFKDDSTATESFRGEGETGIMLWRAGSLGRHAAGFAEEAIELWAIEPTVDDPPQLAAQYSATTWRDMDAFVRDRAHVWLLYTDSTCWEIYAPKARLLDETRTHLYGKPWVEAYESRADRRKEAFATAGLSTIWNGMYGPFA